MANSLSFSVRRQKAVLVAPAKPTPHELKPLSDIDDQEGLRFHIPVIQLYRHAPLMEGRDPARVIRQALARALVSYYPLAGRLRQGSGRKLLVECNGEGVLFIEADADVRLEELGEALLPPFPCMEELLFNVEASDGIVDCPLILIQVTRLRCGGFILALRLNHTVCDAPGLVGFMATVGDMARGALAPAVPPVWARELLSARAPPRPTLVPREYDLQSDVGLPPALDGAVVHRSFFFGPREVAALRKRLPRRLRDSSSRFEILTACIWRSRTIAIQAGPAEEVRIICLVNARNKFSPALPAGYYGNSFAFPTAVCAAGELCARPVGHALELIRAAKSGVTEEYMRSVADLMVLRGRPHFAVGGAFLVSDVTRAGFRGVDFGWGEAAYGGPAKGGVGPFPGLASFYIASRNAAGEEGIAVPVALPAPAMERFAMEMHRLWAATDAHDHDDDGPPHINHSLRCIIRSAL